MGMPLWTNADYAGRAKESGFDGVDLRCIQPTRVPLSSPGNLTVETSVEELDEIRDCFTTAGVEISSLLCYNQSGIDGARIDWDVVERDLVAHARVAERLGCPYLRVKAPQLEPGLWDWDEYLDDLGRVALRAVKETPNVGAIFENHVGQATAFQVCQMVERKGDSRLGVLFAVEHSIVMQEDPIRILESYGPLIRQISLADRRVVEEGLGRFDGRYYYVRYDACRLGEGILPAAAIVDILRRQDYSGYLTLKWEKNAVAGRHLPTGEAELPRFVKYVSSLLAS